MKKKKNQMKHAKLRAGERYGIELKPNAYQTLLMMIWKPVKGKSAFLKRQSNRVTLWALFYEDQWLPVVYDSIRKTIVTILPAKVLKQYTRLLG